MQNDQIKKYSFPLSQLLRFETSSMKKKRCRTFSDVFIF
jgi:hypothetical protein